MQSDLNCKTVHELVNRFTVLKGLLKLENFNSGALNELESIIKELYRRNVISKRDIDSIHKSI